MGKPKRMSNTRASTSTSSKELFKKKTKSKQMKIKGKKLHIKNKKIKINKNYIIEELEELEEKEEKEVEDDDEIMDIDENDNIIKDNNNMTNTAFKEKLFGKLDVLEMERNIEDIKM